MPIKYIVSAVSALGILSLTSAASAGGCAGPDCVLGMQYIPGNAPRFDSMTVATPQPMGHLKSINFQRAPHVSIMRVHGLGPNVELSDGPTGFTEGCHPTSTRYCRQDVNTTVHAPAPIMHAPAAPAPLYRPAPPQSYTPQPMMNSGTSYSGTSTSGYWEKVSGPRTIDGMMATQVICRRPAPQPVAQPQTYYRVVRPIVHVPVPVPTPVPAPMPALPYCGGR
ncbi:hypothetical protein DES40_2161 [Litorimonas taeanensis]|uniref:Uncharacterized protein n=1 Tax=Litorimonas taeanensis TaxID=568099 RepID=A0A420WEB8_9PROT|nr:hypothetical protein [Litorimonas taeanensis]RKQ69361.1 hypothetical protein DES40_2161 [Litorimonas taeanensis]